MNSQRAQELVPDSDNHIVSSESSLRKSSAQSLRRRHRWHQVQSLFGDFTDEIKCKVSSETSPMKSRAESLRRLHWWNQVQSHFAVLTDEIKCSLFGDFTDEFKGRVSSESSLMKSSAQSLRRLHWKKKKSSEGPLARTCGYTRAKAGQSSFPNRKHKTEATTPALPPQARITLRVN